MLGSRGAIVDAVCPRCGASSVPTDERMITCRSCALVFVPREIETPVRRVNDLPEHLDLPDGLTARRDGDTLRIVWRFDDVGPVVAMSLLFGSGPVLAAYFVPVSWAIDIAVGTSVYFAYLIAARALGRREIVIDRHAITRSVRPLPLGFGVRVRRDEIVGIAVRHTLDRGRQGNRDSRLVLQLQDGSEVELFGGAETTHGAKLAALRGSLAVLLGLSIEREPGSGTQSTVD